MADCGVVITSVDGGASGGGISTGGFVGASSGGLDHVWKLRWCFGLISNWLAVSLVNGLVSKVRELYQTALA